MIGLSDFRQRCTKLHRFAPLPFVDRSRWTTVPSILTALHTESGAAHVLGQRSSPIRRLVRERKIPNVELPKEGIRFDADDLPEFVETLNHPVAVDVSDVGVNIMPPGTNFDEPRTYASRNCHQYLGR